MPDSLKQSLRESPVRPLYLWLANRYRGLRRLYFYPDTARVGVVDYDDYWDSKAQAGMGILSPWRLKRAQVFASIVTCGDRVLDLDVSDGALLKYLIEAKGIDGYGLDVSSKAVEFCQQQGLNVALADINQPINEVIEQHYGNQAAFNYVILSEIIEHLPDPEKLLNSLHRLDSEYRLSPTPSEAAVWTLPAPVGHHPQRASAFLDTGGLPLVGAAAWLHDCPRSTL